MKRVGLLLVFVLFFTSKVFAYPQSLGRIDESRTNPQAFSALEIKGDKLFLADITKAELTIYDISQKAWQRTGIKISPKSLIQDVFVDESKIYLLDSKANSILIYSLEGKLLNEIKTKGVKELSFKKASRLLVNYQGYIYVLDAGKLYALTKEGMLIATEELEGPVSMSLGEDQMIRVLQHTTNGSQVAVYDLNLVCQSRISIPNPQGKINLIIDMAVNQWGELHIINGNPVSVDKLGADGIQIPESKFGSVNKSKAVGAFKAPSLLKSSSAGEASNFVIYDNKQRTIHLFQDTDHKETKLLSRPTFTLRPELIESTMPLAQDFLETKQGIYMICNIALPNPKANAKPSSGPALVCLGQDGKARFASSLAQQQKPIKSFSALAMFENRLYVLDTKANMVHIFGADDGVYKGESFGGKGSQEGSLKSPASIVVGEDKLIYVADSKNCRISVFDKQGIYVRNIPLPEAKQRPILLRSTGQDLYCLTSDSVILKIPLCENEKIQQLISTPFISSFDIMAPGRIAIVNGKTQKLTIYKGKEKELEYFSQSKKADFPHFKSIYLIRYDKAKQQFAIMDKGAKFTRLLNFYSALDVSQAIRLSLNDELQTVLTWETSQGINKWIVQASDANGSTAYSVSEPRYVVNDPMNSVVSYTVCPVAADGKHGITSGQVDDYLSYARYLHTDGQYMQAIQALQYGRGGSLDPRIDLQIVKNYLAEADVHELAKNYVLVHDYLDRAAAVRGSTTEIALKKVHAYKASKDYLVAIKYLEGVNYRQEQDLFREYIALQYLNEASATVIEMADLYMQDFGRDATVLRYMATVYDETQKYDQALSGFQELVKIASSFEDELKIGELQMKVGQLKAAESYLQQMLTRSPSQKLDQVYFLLGECSMKSGSYGNATDHYLSAIRSNNSVAKYHYGLGGAYMEDNKPSDALNSFKKAYEQSSANAPYGFAYARVLERQGNIDIALSVMEAVAKYVANDDTAVEFHVLYAELLSNESRYTEALQEIIIAQTYRPDDFDINEKYITYKSAAQAQKLTLDIIEIRSVQFNPVFPSLDEYYKKNPIGKITLFNTRNTTISNVEISVFVQEVGSKIEIIRVPSLIAQQDKVVDITVSFNERLFDSARNVSVEISLKYQYEGMEYNPTHPRKTLQVLSNKAMDWQKRRSLASFVNPQDDNLAYFVKQNIVQPFSTEQSIILNRNLIRALQAYSFYRANGISYVRDSSTSNLDDSELDAVQFPFQLLETKSGDCEDLLVLMAGTLESIGTQTAFIDIPGHVMLAIKTEMTAAEITKNGLSPEYFIESHGAFWLPLETTMMGKADFVASWLGAIRHYQNIVESGVMPEIIEFEEAHKLYPASSFSKAVDSATYRNISEAKSFYQQDLDKMLQMTQINQEMDFCVSLESYPENVSVKLQYAMWCVKMNSLDKAERLLKEIQIQDPQHFYATLNLGNVYAKTSRLELARTQYLNALDKTATETDQVFRNLCLLEYRDLNRAKALEYFRMLENKEIIRQVDLQIYADLMKTGE